MAGNSLIRERISKRLKIKTPIRNKPRGPRSHGSFYRREIEPDRDPSAEFVFK